MGDHRKEMGYSNHCGETEEETGQGWLHTSPSRQLLMGGAGSGSRVGNPLSTTQLGSFLLDSHPNCTASS